MAGQRERMPVERAKLILSQPAPSAERRMAARRLGRFISDCTHTEDERAEVTEFLKNLVRRDPTVGQLIVDQFAEIEAQDHGILTIQEERRYEGVHGGIVFRKEFAEIYAAHLHL